MAWIQAQWLEDDQNILSARWQPNMLSCCGIPSRGSTMYMVCTFRLCAARVGLHRLKLHYHYGTKPNFDMKAFLSQNCGYCDIYMNLTRRTLVFQKSSSLTTCRSAISAPLIGPLTLVFYLGSANNILTMMVGDG